MNQIDKIKAKLAVVESDGARAYMMHTSDVKSLLAEVERLQQAQRWIPVSDGTPELNKDGQSADLLIAIRYGLDKEDERPILCAGYYLDDAWWTYTEHNCGKVGDGEYRKGDRVVAWCYQPEPPKEG